MENIINRKPLDFFNPRSGLYFDLSDKFGLVALATREPLLFKGITAPVRAIKPKVYGDEAEGLFETHR